MNLKRKIEDESILMNQIDDYYQSRTSNTVIIKLERKGKGFTCVGFYKCEGIKRYMQFWDNRVDSDDIEPLPYSLFLRKLQKYLTARMISFPVVYNLTEPAELLHVLYFCKSEESSSIVRQTLIKCPRDITSEYYINNKSMKELSEKELMQ